MMDSMLQFFQSKGKDLQVDWASVVLQRVLEIFQPQWQSLEQSFKSLENKITTNLQSGTNTQENG